MKITGFEWDEGNALHIELRHGIMPADAEEVFAVRPIFRKTKREHYSVLGPTIEGRYLTLVFELKKGRTARVITGWDMKDSERRYYRKYKGR